MHRNTVLHLDLQILRCHDLPKQVISWVCSMIYSYSVIALIQRALSVLIELFHLTSLPPCWCPQQWNGGHVVSQTSVETVWKLNLSRPLKLAYVPRNLHSCWQREWKRSINESTIEPYLTQVHDNTLVYFLPQVSSENLNEWDLQRWNLAVHEDSGEVKLNLESNVNLQEIKQR